MKDAKWLHEKSPLKLMLKLNEEVGEITHAFMRGQADQAVDECDDAALILERLKEVIGLYGIEDING